MYPRLICPCVHSHAHTGFSSLFKIGALDKPFGKHICKWTDAYFFLTSQHFLFEITTKASKTIDMTLSKIGDNLSFFLINLFGA